LHMRFTLQLSSEEIAQASDMNAAQVRKRLSRSVDKLRKHPAIREFLQLN